MGEKSAEKQVTSVSELQRNFSRLGGKIITVLAVVLIYSIVQLFRFGNESDYLLLSVGSILAGAAVFGYIVNELVNGVKRRKNFLAMLLAFGGFLPWAFGSYLVFISGFWSLKNLADGFSIIVILKALIFIFLGYVVVSNFYKITQIGQDISKGVFTITDE